MATCTGVDTLDPLQTILDQTSTKIFTLERQARGIKPFVDIFRTVGSAFPPALISPESTVNSALNEFTAEAICASSTDLAPINDLVEDCLGDALRGVKGYLSGILGKIEDGIDLIADILALPENVLMKQLQKIWKLCDDIAGLINSLDGKIQCVSTSSQGALYQSQIDDLNDRIDTVIDDLYLADDGSFDHERLMTGFHADLQTNIDSYKTRSENLQQEIQDEVSSTVDLTAMINPKNYF